jgi:hypothetical protein
MGLSNITSRVESLNGELQMSSNEGNGMQVVVRINTMPSDVHTKIRGKRVWQKR